MRVNLLGEDTSLQIQWIEVFVAVLIILIVAVPALNYYINYVELKGLERERNMWEDRVAEIQIQEEQYFELQEKIDSFRLPEEVEVQRYAIAPAFREFGKILPDRIGFESMSYQQGELSISGHANSIELILDMVGNIYESDVFTIVSLERFQSDDMYQFNLVVRLQTREEI